MPLTAKAFQPTTNIPQAAASLYRRRLRAAARPAVGGEPARRLIARVARSV